MCHYVRLSAGAHGFHDMSYMQAANGANELGAVREVTTYTNNSGHKTSFSISFHDENNDEVFQYSFSMNAGQVFDPPRKCSEYFLYDRTI